MLPKNRKPANAQTPAPPAHPATASPASSLIDNLRQLLGRYVPFSQMQPEHVDFFITHAREAYFAPEEQVLSPQDGPVRQLYFIRQGAVTGVRGVTELYEGSFQYESGDMFPVAALMGRRAVTATYTSMEDTFCLLLPQEAVSELMSLSAPFADLLNRRMLQFIDAARRSLQSAYSSQTLAEQSLEKRLGEVCSAKPKSCRPDTPIVEALRTMHQHRIGSMLVTDDEERPAGILTRYDILGRITLPQLPLSAPISAVMTQPVQSLTVDHTAQDAALLMSRHGVRHVPVTAGGRLVGIVSERDLFVMQRLSLKQLSTTIRAAEDVDTMQVVAADLRQFVRNLLGQGVQAKQLTELISHLNDVLCQRLVQIIAARHPVDLDDACWLAFGSEGRSEQTIATDQDNGLIFRSEDPEADRPRWLALAREVNEALDACGYPLCKGNVMASNPECCLTLEEWCARFERWIEQGSPEDLLKASTYFDFRPVAGNLALAEPLREFVSQRARSPRFCRLLAEDLLRTRAPLNWMGNIDTVVVDGVETIDLKMRGTAIFVDVARLHALRLGVPEVNTRRRFEALAHAVSAEEHHSEAWISAFEYLQMLRLRAQLEGPPSPPSTGNPNILRVDSLNDIDRRILKESFRVARRLQQRIELDFMR
ncbi:DUF294 nucleotidyltransferase-like domain-containing protein [Caldimonas tepidiphila]|uniref:DUF294 nucleotidyltransferase-like domain-containing protein n=1 Tax=Caldimonas tepidiphila TaxID=2315841 RepID=UPI001F0C1AD1|nr:DUF294 nucleotidyltransferase-like domain-containing protein [Caldimonas tepidiphila]